MTEREHVVFCRMVSRYTNAVEALSYLRGLLAELPYDEAPCRIYVGTIRDSTRSIRDSYRKARGVQRIAVALKLDSPYLFSHDVDILVALQNDDILMEEIEYLQRKITTFDACETLEAYLGSDSIKKAADMIFVHENTIRYRLRKIADLLQLDLNDPLTRLNLQTRIKLWRLSRNNIA